MAGEKNVFNNPNWQVRGNVYQIAGDLVLTPESSRMDFARAVEIVRAELTAAQGIDEPARRELTDQLSQTAAEARTPKPDKDTITSGLTRTRDRLRALGGAASAVLDVATKVGDLLSWASEAL